MLRNELNEKTNEIINDYLLVQNDKKDDRIVNSTMNTLIHAFDIIDDLNEHNGVVRFEDIKDTLDSLPPVKTKHDVDPMEIWNALRTLKYLKKGKDASYDEIQPEFIEEKKLQATKNILSSIHSEGDEGMKQIVLAIVTFLSRTPNIIVLDGLNALGSENIRFLNFDRLINKLRQKSLLSILVYEPSDKIIDYIEYKVDMVLDLTGEEQKGSIEYFLYKMQISKARYQSAALGVHQYKIRDWGFDIFPSLHFLVRKKNYLYNQLMNSFLPMYGNSDNEKNGKEEGSELDSIIDSILGGIKQGSSTVLLGSRGTFKSILSLEFLRAIGKVGKTEKEGEKEGPPKSLLVSLIDNESTILNQAKCVRNRLLKKESGKKAIDESCKDCFKHTYLFHQRPGCISPQEFFYFLQKRIEYTNKDNDTIKRLAFWDLTQIEYRFPLFVDDPMFLPTLLDYLKEKKISSLIMGSGNAKTSKASAAMADNVLFLWRGNLIIENKYRKELKRKINEAVTKENNKRKDIREDGKNTHKKKCRIYGETSNVLEKYFKPFLDKKKKSSHEGVLIYIDRNEGSLGSEGKALYFLKLIKLIKNKNKKGKVESCISNIPISVKEDWIEHANEKISSILKFQGFEK